MRQTSSTRRNSTIYIINNHASLDREMIGKEYSEYKDYILTPSTLARFYRLAIFSTNVHIDKMGFEHSSMLTMTRQSYWEYITTY
jgi:hypothetical protein